jgi:hypothetical protein
MHKSKFFSEVEKSLGENAMQFVASNCSNNRISHICHPRGRPIFFVVCRGCDCCCSTRRYRDLSGLHICPGANSNYNDKRKRQTTLCLLSFVTDWFCLSCKFEAHLAFRLSFCRRFCRLSLRLLKFKVKLQSK